MTREKLRGIAEFALDYAIKVKREGQYLLPYAHVITEADDVDVIAAVPSENHSVQEQKDAYAQLIKDKIAETNATAVILLNDATQVQVTHPEGIHRLFKNHEYFPAAEIVKRGWGKSRDILIATIETKDGWKFLIRQAYRVNSHGALILEEREEHPEAEDAEGRFMNFFPHGAQA